VARGQIDGRDAFRVLTARNIPDVRPGRVVEYETVRDWIDVLHYDVTIVELVEGENKGRK
jgi:hypothetical protein